MINKPVPQFANPADFFMKVLSVSYPKQKADIEKLEYLNRNYHAILEKSVKAEGRIIRLDPPPQDGSVQYKASTSIQLRELLKRSWIMSKREPKLSRAKIFQTIVVTLLMMPVFWQLNNYVDETECVNMAGAIYFLAILQTFLNF